MDIVAHMLWAGAATTLLARRVPIRPRAAAAAVGLAALPDILQFLPVLAWVLAADGTWSALAAHAGALPGKEPAMPPLVAVLSHHLHCIMHSAIVAGAVTVLVAAGLRRFWIPLVGWWSHIAIDVATHSADFYAVPVLYPLTYRGLDGIAWNEPWFLALTYAALALVWAGILLTRSRRRAPSDTSKLIR
jgi:hypothetical protein